MMKPIGLILLVLALFTSCEKAVNFTPDGLKTLVVVDGYIENDQFPTVYLSKSRNYYSSVSPAELDSSFIHDADVHISNGSKTCHMTEHIFQGSNGYNVYYYVPDPLDPANQFLGEFGKSYTLQIKTGGKTYTATTTIPFLKRTLDSVWWKKAPNNPDTTKVVLMGRFTDPPGYGNYIRYYTQTNSGNPFYPGLTSVFDDQIIDGTTYDVQIDKGIDRNAGIDQENYPFFYKGDTATVKLANIDKATYDFWRTMEYNYGSIGNPFSTPTTVLSNIQGGGLGYFGGYAAQYKTIVIPK